MTYYDRQGRRITQEESSRLFLAYGNRVRLTGVGPSMVSTVWLGLNHQYGDGPPLIFESMMFQDSFLEELADRYSTEEEAIAGHYRMVQEARKMRPFFGRRINTGWWMWAAEDLAEWPKSW